MIHDWVYENRAIHLVELTKLGAKVQLLDPHRIIVTGPTRWRGQEIISPRPCVPRCACCWPHWQRAAPACCATCT